MKRHMDATLCISLLLLLGRASCADQPFFESFDRGWESRWAYSNQKKYTGRFDHVTRPHSKGQDMAIKVRCAACGLLRTASRPGTYVRPARHTDGRSSAGARPPAVACPCGRAARTSHPPPHPPPPPTPQVPEPNHQYALSALLPAPLAPGDGLVVQYEAQTAETHNCGGAYLKLLSPPEGWNPAKLRKKTPYSIMFGPDRCGAAARVRAKPPSPPMARGAAAAGGWAGGRAGGRAPGRAQRAAPACLSRRRAWLSARPPAGPQAGAWPPHHTRAPFRPSLNPACLLAPLCPARTGAPRRYTSS